MCVLTVGVRTPKATMTTGGRRLRFRINLSSIDSDFFRYSVTERER